MNKFLFLLLFMNINIESQTLKLDTIDYSKLKFDSTYIITKVTQGKGSNLMEFTSSPLFFFKVSNKPGYEKGPGGVCNLKVDVGDTMIYMDWDIEKKFISEAPCGHCVGKVMLDQKKNVLQIKKCRVTINGQPLYVDRKFKIIKFTSSTIILKDISNIDYNRFYFFTKNKNF